MDAHSHPSSPGTPQSWQIVFFGMIRSHLFTRCDRISERRQRFLLFFHLFLLFKLLDSFLNLIHLLLEHRSLIREKIEFHFG